MTPSAAHREIEAVFRIESAKVIAAVARMVRDVGLAEEVAQDALVAALEPTYGIPARTRRRIASTKSRSCNAFSSRNVFPPPTKMASKSSILSATARGSKPMVWNRARTLAVYAS